jgi:hypothetical protein
MSVDVRTRLDGEQETVPAAVFFGDVLPRALAANGPLLAPAVVALAPPPLVVELPDGSWTLEATDGAVTVRAGGRAGALHLRLSAAQLDDLIADQVTPMGWFSSGALDLDGRLERLLDWWVIWRGALDGVPPHPGGGLDFTDADGGPLDLARPFSVDDPDAELRHFLHEAGYLHLRAVFTEDEMEAVSEDMDRAAPTYSIGDGRSWWAKTADGRDRLVRMQGFQQESDATAAIVTDGRLSRIAELTGDGHRRGPEDANKLEALFKPIGVVEGISDVPWHKDCSLGRHSYDCCSLTVGISVTGADAESGQLNVVAGSHRALVWPALLRRDNDLPVVPLPTATGDVTVHLSCTLHRAEPPVVRERRVLYTGFRLPPLRPGAPTDALVRLRAVREAAAVTVSQPPGYTGG